MNHINDISDKEFIPFLTNLGVETYKKSFEWMLNDPDFADVLRWLYHNLDNNNALSPREEYRFVEIEKKSKLLSTQELESSLSEIQRNFPGICLPGDQETAEDVKLDVNMQKERLNMLEKHEKALGELVRQNELTKEELNVELTKLNALQQQCVEDEMSAGQECLRLAEEVDSIMDGVMDVIADTLNMYGSCHADKEKAKKFFTYGPFDSYRQSQALFRSHFDLYTSKKLCRRQDSVGDEDLRAALVEAKSMEERLSDAMCAYIDTKAELCGEQAKLTLVSNYSNVHPSQIPTCLVEAQSGLELLEQEETIVEQQLQDAVKQLVRGRTSLAVETTARSALVVREQIHKELTYLLECSRRALAVDRALYGALRRELRATQQLLHFAAHLRLYRLADAEAVRTRIQSMNEICAEQESAERSLQTADTLLTALCSVLGIEYTSDSKYLVKVHNELLTNIRELKDIINDGYAKKEESLKKFKQSTAPLKQYIWDGCTKQPNCSDRRVARLFHSLKQGMESMDRQIVDASSLFASVKNGDKHSLRKLWQWFLTDQAKLLTAVKNAQRGFT